MDKGKTIIELVKEYNEMMIIQSLKMGLNEYYHKNIDGTFTLTSLEGNDKDN